MNSRYSLLDAFFDEMKAMYQTLRSTGALSYDKVEKMFEEHQAKWPEAIFNEDALLQKTWTYNTLKKKRRKNKTDAPKYYVTGNHEPIIAKETFAAVQQELVRRADLLGDGKRKRVYSGRHPYSGLLFCGECRDLFSRVIWTIHGRKQTVWRCITRMQSGNDTCHCRTIDEEMLQRVTTNAINRAFRAHQAMTDEIIECVDDALNEVLTEQAEALEEQIRVLQVQLLSYRSDAPEVESIGAEIIKLREQKDELLSQTALGTQRANEIKELAAFFDGLSGPLTEYDETYVRRLLSRITVFDDRLVFVFKDGREITIKE